MRPDDARRILGLSPGEDPAGRLQEFEGTRERLAVLVRNAPNQKIAVRYQEGLDEFDRALAAIREQNERKRDAKMAGMMALVPNSVSGRKTVTKREGFADEAVPPRETKAKTPEAKPFPAATKVQALSAISEIAKEAVPGLAGDPAKPKENGAGVRYSFYILLFILVGGIGGGGLYLWTEKEKRIRVEARLIFLEGLGGRLVEARRWEEATAAYTQMEELDPGSEAAQRGRRSVEFGMRQEQEQFVGYWSGEALAAFEAGRLEDASAAASKVLEKYPREKDAANLFARIEQARVVLLREQWQEKLEGAIEGRKWDEVETVMEGLRHELQGDPVVKQAEKRVMEAREKHRLELLRAWELAEAARLRDKGVYDPQALEWIREALSLAPHDERIVELYEKLSSYSRTVRVPEDAKTLAEAFGEAKPKDRILLGEGRFEGGGVVLKPVQLEGAGEGKTVVHFPAAEGPALSFGPGAQGSSAAGIAFMQEGFDLSERRYPAVLVRGASVEFTDCEFREGSGYGLGVLDGGAAVAVRCAFSGNGWGGAGARGSNSRLALRGCVASENFGHGYEVWDGALAQIENSKAVANVRSGVLIDSAAGGMLIRGNTIEGNREYGMVLQAGASGEVVNNKCAKNLMGGLLVRFAAISVRVEGNQLERNDGPGLILEQGLRPDIYEDNSLQSNSGKDMVSQVRFEGDD